MIKKIFIFCLILLLLSTLVIKTDKAEYIEQVEAYKPYEQVYFERNSIYDNSYDVIINEQLPSDYSYEIPVKYQECIATIIEAIDDPFCLDFSYEFIFENETELMDIEKYLRLYYSDGYDKLYPEYSCSCLFIHGYSIYEHEKGVIVYVDFDMEHCREVKQECIEWKEACIKLQNSLPEIIKNLNLTGYVVHDLKEVHDYICENVVYDYEGVNPYNIFTIGIFEGQSLICQGYSDAMNLICKSIGLECYIDGGLVGGIGHAWNYVIIDDNTYYIDTTWDDYEGGYYYEYFLVSKDFMELTGHEFEN